MLNREVSDELWKFIENKKNYLIYRTTYLYNNENKIVKETEYDQYNNVSRIKEYSINENDQTNTKDSVFSFSHEGIIRVEGKRNDIIITDSLGRPIEKTHFYKDKFLYRVKYRYD